MKKKSGKKVEKAQENKETEKKRKISKQRGR